MASKIPLPSLEVPARSKLSANQKAAATDAAARSITAAETEKRDRKTARLKAARLAMEAENRDDPAKGGTRGKAKAKARPKTKKRA
jgi:hypothetical protein